VTGAATPRYNDCRIFSAHTDLVLGAQEKPRHRNGLRTKGFGRRGFKRLDLAGSREHSCISRWRHWLKERVRAFNARGAHGAEIVEGREAQSNATPIWAPAGAKSGNLGGLSP
jgi:hypothetical protein